MAGTLASIDPRGPAAPIFQSAITSDEVRVVFFMIGDVMIVICGLLLYAQGELEIIRRDPFFYDGDILNKTAFEVLKMARVAKESRYKS
jgi:hypothetical protein